MIGFEVQDARLVLLYFADDRSPRWLDDKLERGEFVKLSSCFTVTSEDLVTLADRPDEDLRCFGIGEVDGEYYIVRRDVLGLKHDLLLSTSVALERKTFIAERNISIFRRIDSLVDEQIVVGGSSENAIPEEEFVRLLQTFPTSTEVKYYAEARVTRILGEYLGTMSNAEERLESYIDRRERRFAGSVGQSAQRTPVANELEVAKFIYVRDRVAEMLEDADAYSESQWQKEVADLFLLIYPQYVAVLHGVCVKERYSQPQRSTNRFIDLALVGADGCLDIIEIKKPFEHSLMTKKPSYRGNHVPLRALSGSIMQAEKYLFYLSKAGQLGESAINNAHAAELPSGLDVRIANPKAIILSGRDLNLTAQQKFDFEFARRTHSNIVDIISYDDLLRRLENVINALEVRVTTDHDLIAETESGA